MGTATGAQPSLWARALRGIDRLRRMFLPAFSRAKDLQGGAAQDTRTGEGRQAAVAGARSERKLDHPILADLRWRAACQILEALGGLTAPRQLRAHVDAVGDPARAVEMLVEDLGCDLERLRAGDVLEQDLFLERVETLVSLDRLLDSAPTQFKKRVIQLFYSGEIARLRTLAETRRNLQTALGLCDDIRAQHRIPAVQRLRAEVAAALEDVEHADAALAEQALESATIFMRVAEQLALTTPRWTSTMKEAAYIWPAAWAALDHPQRRKLGQLERRGAAVLWSFSANEQLSAKAAEQALNALGRALEELEALLAEARQGHERSGGEEASRNVGRLSRDSVNDWLAMLNLPAGHKPSREELSAAYRRVMKKVYPHVNGGDRHAEELVKHINAARDKLKAFYGLA